MPTIAVTTRHWKNVNIQNLCYNIESQLENVNLEDGELDSCVNLFESTVRNILDDHAPLKTRTVKLQSGSPWIPPKTPVLPSTHSDQDLSNAFSNFFVTKIENLCRSFPQYLPFYHKHIHTRTHIVDSLCLSLLVLRRSRNSS